MHNFKDKVSEKFSRLFSDSAPAAPSTADRSKVRSYSLGGNSLSSMFSYMVPSAKLNKFKSNKQEDDIKPIQSEPHHRWNSKSFEWRDEHFASPTGSDPEHDGREISNTHDDARNLSSYRSTCDGDVFEEALDPHSPDKSMPNLTEQSSFIYVELYEFLHSCLPNIVKGCQWVLLYSTLKHGISLRTLIRKSADLPGPCLLITGDMQGAVFGGLLEGPLEPTAKRKYQGTNQTFVFTNIYGEPRLFRSTGANRYFYLCLNDLLALGGGGHFALCLDGDLLNGSSGPCATFGNSCLAHNQEFELRNVELWGFAHLSQYLT